MKSVVVRTKDLQRIIIRFRKEAAIPEFIDRARELVGPNLRTMHIVHAQPVPPPEGVIRPKGKFWCPVCAYFRKWYHDNWYIRCEVCAVSHILYREDFKQFNLPWWHEVERYLQKRAKEDPETTRIQLKPLVKEEDLKYEGGNSGGDGQHGENDTAGEVSNGV